MPDTKSDLPDSNPQGTAPELPEELNDDPQQPADKLVDPETDKAVDDIVAKEGDTVLAVEDAKRARKSAVAGSGGGWKDKLKSLIKNRRFQAGVAIVLLIIFALPVTRYTVLGLFIKEPVTISVLDSKTNTPVSGASVTVGGADGKTNGSGQVTIKARPGKTRVAIAKQYYKDGSKPLFVGLKSAKTTILLDATGRLVPVTVVNKITGLPLANVQIKVLNSTAKTDSKGQATIALPTTANTQAAKLSLSGYNSTDATITVIDKTVKANTLQLTPAGQIYFLSNLSGNLDVVKSNLDGSGRKTVLVGTGHEEASTTSLLASRDWHYLVLKSRRDGNQASLYLIDTSNDKTTQFDNGDADFTLVGWYEHAFVYSLVRNSSSQWQASKQVLKSYDAEHQQLNQLDQNLAEGDASKYAYQNFSNYYILNGSVVYSTQWFTFGGASADGKNDTIRAVSPGGQNKKDYRSFLTTSTGYIQAALYEPQAVYFGVYDNTANKLNYYQFEDQAVKVASVDQSTFDNGYPTFLISLSGKLTFWTELRDGKNSLFTGDAKAGAKKQIATLSGYSPYGWFSDAYTLVSKSSSQLYIMPVGGPASGQLPLKITDYYKPAQNYPGYGYGYGGL